MTGLRDLMAEAITREHYRRAEQRIEASPEEHGRAFADAAMTAVQAALDAKDAEIERLRGDLGRTKDALGLAQQAGRRDLSAFRARDRLKQAETTIERVRALCTELMTVDPADLTRAQRRQLPASIGRALLAALDQPGDQEGTTP